MKYSPQDAQGARRRSSELMTLGVAEWIEESLPTPRQVGTMHESYAQPHWLIGDSPPEHGALQLVRRTRRRKRVGTVGR